jgi:glutaredoxin
VTTASTDADKSAILYRMVLSDHVCPYGVKALGLLRERGFEVEEHVLRTREETDALKARLGVETTPQVFIGGERIGGYGDLRRHLERV